MHIAAAHQMIGIAASAPPNHMRDQAGCAHCTASANSGVWYSLLCGAIASSAGNLPSMFGR
jgi:hypothetical protein